jgi:ABC-type Fe3+-hydroxamate transport system substrate-binding protein
VSPTIGSDTAAASEARHASTSRERHLRGLRPLLSSAAMSCIVALMAAGCVSTSEEQTTAVAAAPPAFERERVIGRWGVASFHTDKDRPRTEREAKAQCSQPYTIAKGPTDGVMMHVADDAKLYELKLKGDVAGRTYIGFEAPPGHPQDREILSSTNNLMTMRFVDPDANRRYGTFVYVRCSA